MIQIRPLLSCLFVHLFGLLSRSCNYSLHVSHLSFPHNSKYSVDPRPCLFLHNYMSDILNSSSLRFCFLPQVTFSSCRFTSAHPWVMFLRHVYLHVFGCSTWRRSRPGWVASVWTCAVIYKDFCLRHPHKYRMPLVSNPGQMYYRRPKLIPVSLFSW